MSLANGQTPERLNNLILGWDAKYKYRPEGWQHAFMKDKHIRMILSAPWSDQKLAERVAQETGAKVSLMASAVGAVKAADNYLDTVDYNVKTVAQALGQ
jgi:hypothetical protein